MKKSVTIFPTIEKRILVDCVVGVPGQENPEQDTDNVICKALIDTGAMRTCISHRIANRLGLLPSGTMKVTAANGHTDVVNTHIINMTLGGDIRFTMLKVPRLRMEDEDMIIGMDILSNGDLLISNTEGTTTVMFQMP